MSRVSYNYNYNQYPGAQKAREPVPKPEYFKIATVPNTVIRVYTADITKLEVGAVVNAANEELQHIGGVAAALLSAAGRRLQQASDEFLRQRGLKTIKTGSVMHTIGFNLKARFVIHAVGPNSTDVSGENEFRHLLRRALENTLRKAQQLRVKTLALPLISGGIFAGQFGKEVPSKVLWEAILGAGELVGTLRVLHLVNNDPSVTNAILRVAHTEPFKELLNQVDPGDCDRDHSSPIADDDGYADANTDPGMDWETLQEGSARGFKEYEARGKDKQPGEQMLATFATESTNKKQNEDVELINGKWMPKSKPPEPERPSGASLPSPSSEASKLVYPKVAEAELKPSGKPEPKSKSDGRADEPEHPFASFTSGVAGMVDSLASSIGKKFSPSPESQPQFPPPQTRHEVRKEENSSGSTTDERLACKGKDCKRTSDPKTIQWFVQPPCKHIFCIECFNQQVKRTGDAKCSYCSVEFQLPSATNKADFMFCANPKGESYVFNSNDLKHFPRWLMVAPASDKERSETIAADVLEKSKFFNTAVLIGETQCYLASGRLPPKDSSV